MKSRDEIEQLMQAATAASVAHRDDPTNEALIRAANASARTFLKAILEYPAPSSDLGAALRAAFNDPSPEISDEVFPMVMMRTLLAVNRVMIDPSAMKKEWDEFSRRYQDAILAA